MNGNFRYRKTGSGNGRPHNRDGEIYVPHSIEADITPIWWFCKYHVEAHTHTHTHIHIHPAAILNVALWQYIEI